MQQRLSQDLWWQMPITCCHGNLTCVEAGEQSDGQKEERDTKKLNEESKDLILKEIRKWTSQMGAYCALTQAVQLGLPTMTENRNQAPCSGMPYQLGKHKESFKNIFRTPETV